ncbi:MAG: hypothetical protein LBU46_02665, partial [Candidatus Accumulibacter sp.]|nr:hypothetical protein [Accumulibacter sp.]
GLEGIGVARALHAVPLRRGWVEKGRELATVQEPAGWVAFHSIDIHAFVLYKSLSSAARLK